MIGRGKTADDTSHLRVRTAATVSTVAMGLVAIVIALALAWTSAAFQRSVATVTESTQTRAIASELGISLLTYQRLANLYVATHEPENDTARNEHAAQMRDLLASARARVRTPADSRLVAQISTRLSSYLQQRARLEAQGMPLPEIVSRTRPYMNNALRSVQALRELNDYRVKQANSDAASVARISRWVGVAAVLLIVLAIAAASATVNRYLVRPILELHRTVARLRAGHVETRASPHGFREIGELAAGLNEMADALARQRSDQLTFLAGVAHDLRNPLAALKIGLQALESDMSEERIRRTCARLERQIDRLSRMVDDLLDATRIEAGKLELRCEDLDLRGIVHEMVELYEPTSPNHSITATFPEAPVIVYGDPLRLAQVASNLLSNAIKFSPAGGTIEVTLEASAKQALLEVTDHGVGIAPEDLSNIFLPFKRQRPEVAAGAGLGLSVVRRIVASHRGTIDVTSVDGAGSTFCVRLPLSRATA